MGSNTLKCPKHSCHKRTTEGPKCHLCEAETPSCHPETRVARIPLPSLALFLQALYHQSNLFPDFMLHLICAEILFPEVVKPEVQVRTQFYLYL